MTFLSNGFGVSFVSTLDITVSSAPLAPIYTPSTPVYQSDFTGVPNQTLLRNISPWVATNRNGNNALAQINDAVILQPQGYINGAAGGINSFNAEEVGQYLFGIETGSARHFIEARCYDNGSHQLTVSAAHNGNRTVWRTSIGAPMAGDWTGASGGETRTSRTITTIPPAAGNLTDGRLIENRGFVTVSTDPAINSRLRVTSFDGKVKVSVGSGGGVALYSFANTNTGTKVGFGSGGQNYRGFDQILVGVLRTEFTITSTTKGWYNRIKGLAGLANGGRRITLSGTWRGELPTGLYWRLVRPTDNTQIKAWAGVKFADTVIVSTGGSGLSQTGTWSATCEVECGLDGVNPYRFQIGGRTGGTFGDNGGSPICNADYDCVTDLAAFYVCVGFIGAGQSEMAGANATVLSGYQDFPGGCWYQQPDSGSTEQLYGTNTAWLFRTVDTGANGNGDRQSAWFCKVMSQAYNMPVSLAFVSKGARGSADLTPGGAEWPSIQAHLGFLGCYEHILLAQGSAEAYSSGVANWQNNWANGIPAYLGYANQPASHVPYVFMVPTGFISYPGDPSIVPVQLDQARQMRSIQLGFPAYMASRPTPINVVRAASFLDLTVVNGEFDDSARTGGEGLRRIAITVAKTLGLTGSGWGGYDGRGPVVSSVVKTSNTLITVTYNLNGATSLSGSSLTDHKVYLDANRVTPVTITGPVNVSGNTVTIPIASTAAPVYWCDYDGANPSQTGRAMGNYATPPDSSAAGALTIPAMFTPDPILAT